MFKHFFKEPLVVFLFLGGSLFGFYQWISTDSTYDENLFDEIVITSNIIEALALNFEQVWQRPPSEQELENLTQAYIKEEVFYREALAMGLEKDDTIIRRRLTQKLQFISEDLAALIEPDDNELQEFLNLNAEKYQQPSIFSFQQVYLKAEEIDNVELALKQLRSGQASPDEINSSHLIQSNFNQANTYNIERTFGREFTEGLKQLATGDWQGPVKSGFGLHLVKISERIDGKNPPLSDVKNAVLRDWSTQNQKQINEVFYTALRQRYTISFDTAFSNTASSNIDNTLDNNQ